MRFWNAPQYLFIYCMSLLYIWYLLYNGSLVCCVSNLRGIWFHRISKWQRFGASNHWRLEYLFNRLFRCRSKETPCVTCLCVANPTVTGGFPTQRASDAENVSIWWRHTGPKAWPPSKFQKCLQPTHIQTKKLVISMLFGDERGVIGTQIISNQWGDCCRLLNWRQDIWYHHVEWRVWLAKRIVTFKTLRVISNDNA